MQLKIGTTGFFSAKTDDSPYLEEKYFKARCYAFIHEYGGQLIEFLAPTLATNFFQVQLMLNNEIYYILLNEQVPYMAFASSVKEFQIQFIELPELATYFSSDYIILQPTQLEEFPFPSLLSELDRLERYQINFWKPKRLGEIIFNYWD